MFLFNDSCVPPRVKDTRPRAGSCASSEANLSILSGKGLRGISWMRTKMRERGPTASPTLSPWPSPPSPFLLATGFLREQPNVQLEGAVKERWRAAEGLPPPYRAHWRVANLSCLAEIEMLSRKNVVILSVCRSLLFEAGLWSRSDGWAGPSPPPSPLPPRHCLIRTSRRRSRLNIQKTFA